MPGPIRELHAAALALHKTLLEAVRREYEKAHGRVENPNALLALVLSHEDFAWLRSLSQLIVEIDELEETPDAGAEDLAAALAAFEDLTSRSGERFQTRYEAAVDANPDVALAHGRLQRVLGNLPEPRETDAAALAARRLRWGAPPRR